MEQARSSPRRRARIAATRRRAAAAAATSCEVPFVLMADGVACAPVPLGPDGRATVFRCVVPSGVRSVTLVSENPCSPFVGGPVEARRGPGIAVTALRTRTGTDLFELPLSGSMVGSGWHGLEAAATYRRTAGEARLRLPHGTTVLEVSVLGWHG